MLADVFGPDMAVVLLLGLVLPIWAMVDALSRPAAAFYGAGWNRTAWVVVLAVSLFVGLGLLFGAYYLIFVRRRVRVQMQRLAS